MVHQSCSKGTHCVLPVVCLSVVQLEVSEKTKFIKIWVLNSAGVTPGASPCPASAPAVFWCQPVAGRAGGDGALPLLAEG